MNILLSLFELIFGIIKFIVKIYYYPFQKIRSLFLDNHYKKFDVKNIFMLLFKILFLCIYEFLVFHIYIFIYLIHDSSIEITKFGIILRFIIIFIASCFLAAISDEFKDIFYYLINLIESVFHLVLWIFALFVFLFTFNKDLLDIILFKKTIREFKDLLNLFAEIFITFFGQFFRYILFIAHLLNIFSIIRIIEIYKNKKDEIPTGLLIKSFGNIFLDIFVLTPGYISIILLPPLFFLTNVHICKNIFKHKGYLIIEEKEDSEFYLYPKYTIIKKEILKNSKNVFIYMIASILTIISIPFIWRLHITISIIINLFKTADFKKFIVDYYNNMIECFLPIISLIPLIIVHLSPIHLKAIYDYYYNNKRRDNSKRYFCIILMIFFEKWLDIIVFIISLIRLLTINYYLYLLRKKCKIEFLFLLLNNEEIKENNSNRINRVKILKISLYDILISFMIIFQILIGSLNPFLSLKIIKDIVLYFIKGKNNTEINFKKLEMKFLIKSYKNIFLSLFVVFIYIPFSLLLNVLAFWTIKYDLSLLVSTNKKAYNKLINYDGYTLENNNNKNIFSYINKYCQNLITIFKSFIYGYILIFEFIFIHITLFRTISLWKKFTKKENNISLELLIKEQFNLAIKEFIFIPFILIIIILEPWNYELMLDFFSEKYFSDKLDKFGQLIILFINDILLLVIFILLMVTIIDTIPTILLIVRSIKKKCYPTEENKLKYNLNYKTDDFKTELKTLYNKNVKKFTTTFLFILNILLISRIIPLIKNTYPFFVLFFKKCKNNLIKFFSCKKNKEKKDNDKLTKMPLLIMNEICSFLNPRDINLLSRANKKINEKTNINYIWENIFYNKCDKKLKQVLDENEYKNFSHTKFETYKETCKNCYYIVLAKRGKIVGQVKTFTDIVEEESIKSIFNIPYIILIPRILLSYILQFINYFLYSIYSFLIKLFGFTPIIKEQFESISLSKEKIEKNFFISDLIEILYLLAYITCILHIIFSILNYPLYVIIYYTITALFSIYKFFNYYLLVSIDDINNIQNQIANLYSTKYLIFLKNLLGLFIIIIQTVLITYIFLIKIHIFIIRCLTLNFNYLESEQKLESKINNCPFIMLLLQLIYGLIYFIIKYLLFILPSIYYIFIDLNLKTNLIPYYVIKNLSDIIYNSNFWVLLQIFSGKYCLNIPFYFLNLLSIKHVINYLNKTSDIVFIDILANVFQKYTKCWYYFNLFPIKFLIMYVYSAFRCINIKMNKKLSSCFSFIINIISLIFGLSPLYLMYACFENNKQKIIFFEVPLLIYSIINLYVCSQVLK